MDNIVSYSHWILVQSFRSRHRIYAYICHSFVCCVYVHVFACWLLGVSVRLNIFMKNMLFASNNEWLIEWKSEWMNEWVSAWMNEWLDERINYLKELFINVSTLNKLSDMALHVISVCDNYGLEMRPWKIALHWEASWSASKSDNTGGWI